MADPEPDESEGQELLPVKTNLNCKPVVGVLKSGPTTKNHLSVTILELSQSPSLDDNDEEQRKFLPSQSDVDSLAATPTIDTERRASQISHKDNTYGKLFKKINIMNIINW